MFPQPDWTDGRDCIANLYSKERLLLANAYLICYQICHPHPNEITHYIKYHTKPIIFALLATFMII